MKRLHVCRLVAFKGLAKKISKELDMKHGHVLERFSIAHGYASYFEVVSQVGRNPPQRETHCLAADLGAWKAQLSTAFRTEFDSEICGNPAELWFARVCLPRSDGDEKDGRLPSQTPKVGGHTVSLHGTAFEVDAALAGQTVTLRYDPSIPAGRGIEVWHEGRLAMRAKPVDAYANGFVRRRRPTQTIEPAEPAEPAAPAAPPTPPRPSNLARRNKCPKPANSGLPGNPDANPNTNDQGPC